MPLQRYTTDCYSIVAAVLNKYYSFTNPFGTEWTIWYLRESYTAILCANLPLIYPLIQRVFKLRNWNSNSYNNEDTYRLDSQPHGTSSQPTWTRSRPKPAHRGMRDTVRRANNQEIMDYSIDDDRGEGPHFITSAIDMGDTRSQTSAGLDTPVSWRSDDSKKGFADPYHAV
jgi:hypothetical protein